MEKIKNNLGLITYIIITIIITIIMFWAIDKKEGFHEDEIFSYGASNSTFGNTFLSFGRIDDIDSLMKNRNPILTLKKFIYYKVIDREAYNQAIEEYNKDNFKSVWRTREDAIEYLQIDNFLEAIDFFSVYWNTAKDVHPPLFYFAVHIVSILFWGHFSKYIIFWINIVFFIATLWILRKIFILINKKYLAIPNLILYGASIGAISTVMFQRMYMMLTFFTVWFLYANLKLYYNNFEITKNIKKELMIITVLGFLTQYNFCFYALFLVITMIVIAIIQKKKIKEYILLFVKSALIGLLIFLPAIYHIFFSYRGIGGRPREFTIFEAIIAFLENLFNAYSIPFNLGIILSIILIIMFIFKFIKGNLKEVYSILVFPTILTFLMMIIMSPYKSLRYVMFILPLVSIIFLILIDDLIDNKKFSVSILIVFAVYLSIYGIFTNPIKYLYKGYNEYLKIAEKYKDNRFVVVTKTEFSHIKDVPEYKIYEETLMISPDRLEDLKDYREFEFENEFILGIKNWIDGSEEEILAQVMEYTKFNNYEFIYSSDKSARLSIYKLTK